MHCIPGCQAAARCTVAGAALVFALAASSGDAVLVDAMHGPLDGMTFVGTFGPPGSDRNREDALSFGNGQFWSAICVPCGFLPSTYWIRRVGDAIHSAATCKASNAVASTTPASFAASN